MVLGSTPSRTIFFIFGLLGAFRPRALSFCSRWRCLTLSRCSRSAAVQPRSAALRPHLCYLLCSTLCVRVQSLRLRRCQDSHDCVRGTASTVTSILARISRASVALVAASAKVSGSSASSALSSNIDTHKSLLKHVNERDGMPNNDIMFVSLSYHTHTSL